MKVFVGQRVTASYNNIVKSGNKQCIALSVFFIFNNMNPIYEIFCYVLSNCALKLFGLHMVMTKDLTNFILLYLSFHKDVDLWEVWVLERFNNSLFSL